MSRTTSSQVGAPDAEPPWQRLETKLERIMEKLSEPRDEAMLQQLLLMVQGQQGSMMKRLSSLESNTPQSGEPGRLENIGEILRRLVEQQEAMSERLSVLEGCKAPAVAECGKDLESGLNDEPMVLLEAARQEIAAQARERSVAEARAKEAEARAKAAEAAAREALAVALRAREEEAQRQVECESLRATLQGIRDAGQCPILHQVWKDPVVASDGHSYERKAIEPWLRSHGTSPFTRDRLRSELYPNWFALTVLQQLRGIGLAPLEDAEDPEEDEALGDSSGEESPTQDVTGLWEALQRSDRAGLQSLLALPEVPGLNRRDAEGFTALQRALVGELPEVALMILARHDFTEVNAKTQFGFTALHMAAFAGHLLVCQAIVGHRQFSELWAVTNRRTASEFARRRDVADFLEAAQDSTAPGPNVLREAIRRRGEVPALRLLQRQDLPGLNEIDAHSCTVLHVAVWKRLPEVALAILARSDFQAVNAKNHLGETALHGAAREGLLDVCRAIIERADFEELQAVDDNGFTAAQLAHDFGHGPVLEFLERGP